MSVTFPESLVWEKPRLVINKEIKKAITIVQKKKSGADSVSILFNEIAQDFEDKLKVLEQGYPYEATQRNPLLVEELTSLNLLWSRISSGFAKGYYEILLMLAQEVAASSGGLLGMKRVGSEEARWVKLPMIKKPVT